MSFIVLEGLDRTGKSTVAELYKKKGFEVVHTPAPDKKYTQDGYAGPSYLDDVLEVIMQLDGRDVIWDRSWYGELIWSHVYNRKPLLSEEDIEIIQDFEDRNNCQRILMIDPNAKEHWDRCVANNEPLNIQQFKLASALFNKMAHKYNFIPQQLGDFNVDVKTPKQDILPEKSGGDEVEKGPQPIGADELSKTDTTSNDSSTSSPKTNSGKSQEQEKLEKANAINSILSKRIVRQKGMIFDRLEEDIKLFLQDQLSIILGSSSETPTLSTDEVQLLKIYCSRIMEKQKSKGE